MTCILDHIHISVKYSCACIVFFLRFNAYSFFSISVLLYTPTPLLSPIYCIKLKKIKIVGELVDLKRSRSPRNWNHYC